MTDEEWRGGLAPHYDYMLAEKPDDPKMRESASIWLFEENGEFAFPRVGIEAIGEVWDRHRYDVNIAFSDGRALHETNFAGESHSPIGKDGKPTILGSGGLTFECIEPYRRWRVRYDGQPVDTSTAAMIRQMVDKDVTTPVRFDVELEMVTPCWVQDNTPEKLATMSERERSDAGLMGFGYRMEHLYRATGTLEVGGSSRDFRATGIRVHRQSVRPLDAFRGHCWLSAVFPNGDAFALIAYPPAEDGSTYNEGVIYKDGKMHPAKATEIPFLTEMMTSGDDVSFELKADALTIQVHGVTTLNTFKVGTEGELAGFTLQQGGARYTWDGQVAYGMVERSSWNAAVAIEGE